MFGDKCCDQFEQVIVEELFFLQLGTKYYGRDKTFFSCSCSKNRTMLCMLKGVFIIKQWWGIFVNFITKSAPPPFFSITLKKMIDFSIYYYCYEVLNCGFFSQMSPKWVMVAIAAKLSVNNEWSQQVTWYCTCAWMDVGGWCFVWQESHNFSPLHHLNFVHSIFNTVYYYKYTVRERRRMEKYGWWPR